MPFPSTLSSFSYPNPNDRLNNPSHSGIERTQSSAIGQIETVIGTDASIIGTIIGDLRNASSSGGGHVQTANKGGTGQTSFNKGDLLVGQSSSVLSKLAIGSDTQTLVADSGSASGVKWASTSSIISGDLTYIEGTLSPGYVKTYFNFQLPFILWTGAVANDTTTTFANWIRNSSDITIPPMGAMAQFGGAGADTIYMDTPFVVDGGSTLKFNATNIIIMDFWAKFTISPTGDTMLGFVDGVATLSQVYNSSTGSRVAFCVRASDGHLYATISKDSVGNTATDISSGLNLQNWNNLRIVFDISNNALFYVNGILLATLSGANLQTGTGGIQLGFGRSNTAGYAVTAPVFSMQMNP